MILTLLVLFKLIFNLLFVISTITVALSQCGQDDDPIASPAVPTAPSVEKKKKKKKKKDRSQKEADHEITPPEDIQGPKVDADDPNYQTLNGINDNVFDKQKTGPKVSKNKPVPMAATHDPNYQTLAGINNNVFDGPKQPVKPAQLSKAKAQKQATKPKVTKKTAVPMAGTCDPNYQTLAGINDNVFDKPAHSPALSKAKAVKKPQKTPVPMAGTLDPNYQTLAGLDNENIFKNKGGTSPAPKQPTQDRGKAATFDPNYQTLAGLNQDVFGADKKRK